MRKAYLILSLALVTFFATAWPQAAQAEDGYWTDVNNYCPGIGCPDLGASCMSHAEAVWPGNSTGKLLSCDTVDVDQGQSVVQGICCGATYTGPHYLTCPSGETAIEGVTDGCIPDWPPCIGCVSAASGGGAPPFNPPAGNPIYADGGNKQETVVDFSTPGPNALAFIRTYNSHTKAITAWFAMPLGMKWQSNFDAYIGDTSSTVKRLYRPDGPRIEFILTGGIWTPPADFGVKLVQLSNGWQFTDEDDTVETYDSSFRLTSIVKRNGYTQTLTRDGSGVLTGVTDSYGRTLTFTYTGKRMTAMTAPDGGVYSYTYDRSFSDWQTNPDRLIKVTYPKRNPAGGAAQATYHYEDGRYPGFLTGITDENGVRYVTWTYDDSGRAISSSHAGGADSTTIAFNADGSRTVTNALGKQTINNYVTVQGRKKRSSSQQLASLNSPAATELFTYNVSGYMSSYTDANGTLTTFSHDSRGLQTSRTLASGTALARTITTAWHATFRVPTQITEPGKTTTFTYDAQGRVLTRTETDTRTQTIPYSTNGRSRTWTYTWSADGLMQTVNGPRTDLADTTSYTWSNGVLSAVTNALGHATQITAHNARGLPLTITDPNGVVTDLAYNARGELTRVTKHGPGGDAITDFEYDNQGQIAAIVAPDDSRTAYTYDSARRLTAVQNDFGERIEYTLDAMGNRTAEKIKTSTGTIVKSMTHTYDELGHLLRDIGAANQTTIHGYDVDNNVVSITDPLNGATTQAYDALNRLIASTDPLNGITDYGYDSQDNLISVIDPRDVQTDYVHDGLGNLIQVDSPDAGVTVHDYDAAGNRISQTDARGIITNYAYDALDRLTARTYPSSAPDNIAYQYDDPTSGGHGIGRLFKITDKSGSTQYAYDSRGNVATVTRVIGGRTYVTGYSYDVSDRLTSVAYPSGRIIDYARDDLGRVELVTLRNTATSAPVTIAANLQYKPFGPLSSLTYGNGLTLALTYDSDYRLTGLVTSGGATNVQNLSYAYDAAGNILSIGDALDAARSQTFVYDGLFRLTRGVGPYGTIDYAYDAVGNRTGRTVGATVESYTYDSFSNRLLSKSGGGSRTFTHDAAGNITTDSRGGTAYDFAYDATNRMAALDIGGLDESEYRYNALGERVLKQDAGVPASATHFQFDESGRLIGEMDSAGAPVREYVYLDGLPIALLQPGSGGSAPVEAILDNSDAGAAASTANWTTETSGAGYYGANYRRFTVRPVIPGGAIVDNTSPGFKTTGIWTGAATPTGFEGTDYLGRTSTDSNGTDVIVDNTDAAFTKTGIWIGSTGVSGYYGTNFFTHYPPNQPSPEAIVIDNVDAGFTLQGAWDLSTAEPDRWGIDYRAIDANSESWEAVITDNGTNTTEVGSWTNSTNTPRIGANFRYAAGGAGASTYTWTPALATARQYKVYGYWRADTNRATNAPFTIHHDGGATTILVDQKVNGGQWNLLATVGMTPGQNHRVVLTNNANGFVIADAVKAIPTDALPNKAVWTPTIPAADSYKVYAYWPAHSNRTDNAPYTVFHAGGSTTVNVNQKINGGQWNYLGTFAMAPGAGHRVELTDLANPTRVIADAVAFSRVGLPPPTSTWTPVMARRDSYDVYARWTAASSRATDVPYTVTYEGGSATVAKNQQINGGSFQLLGSFIMAPGQGHRVDMTDVTSNGTYIIADAVKLTPSPAVARVATWPIAAATTGNYKVYAKWPASSQHATDAVYTVSHATGSTPVTVNQRLNGGQWNLLGSFAFNAGGSGYKVELSDAASGKVAADSIYYVRDAAPSGETFTWEPAIPSSGIYAVYARWTANSLNTAVASYSIVHAGGTASVIKNQRISGGIWRYLGSFEFSPNAGHKVILQASADGDTIADAVRLVGSAPAPANVVYIHGDHLGTPQKMTDASKVITWDRVQDPFGNTHSLAGAAQNPLRFPGQYADEESSLTYNYFRDYDPTLGRYVQTDLIGLGGGLNTFVYVANNPEVSIDLYGLNAIAPTVGSILEPALIRAGAAASIDGILPFGDAYAIGYLIGTGIKIGFMACTGSLLDSKPVDCDKVYKKCFKQCQKIYVEDPESLPGVGHDRAGRLRRCVRECMDAEGCYGD